MQTAAQAIQVERHPVHASAVTIRLSRPQRRNALRVQDMAELGAALLRLQLDPSVSTILVTGASGAFTAGADINDLNRLSGAEMGAYMDATSDILTRVLSMPKVVIALVNGPSAGFGNHFAACADLCFVHESANFNFTGSAKAIPSMLIGAAVMPLSIGTKRAKSLYLRGGKLSAAQASEWGLANECVSQSRWAQLPDELAAEFEPKSALTLAHNKFQVNQAAFQLIGASRLSILAGAVALSGQTDIPTGGV
jgi:enoyl-CoA hydratase/carnithine racemase